MARTLKEYPNPTPIELAWVMSQEAGRIVDPTMIRRVANRIGALGDDGRIPSAVAETMASNYSLTGFFWKRGQRSPATTE